MSTAKARYLYFGAGHAFAANDYLFALILPQVICKLLVKICKCRVYQYNHRGFRKREYQAYFSMK